MRHDYNLDAGKLATTATALAKWIRLEFPNANLANVADMVTNVTNDARRVSYVLARPMYFVRFIVLLIILAAVSGVGYHAYFHPKELLQWIDDTKGLGIYFLAAAAFLVTLEIRLKRSKALAHIHNLRSLAHIIDMHQLAKDPIIERYRVDPGYDFREKLAAYLHSCTAMLNLVSKVGQVYIDHFHDSVATAAVNDFEAVCNGMANKIWSKIDALPPPVVLAVAPAQNEVTGT